MRIIPKKTKVAMEFFKGVELMDVAVGLIGAVIATAVFMSNLPFKLWIIIGVVIIFAALIIPLDGDKGYMMIINVLKYLARYRKFVKRRRCPEGGQPETALSKTAPSKEASREASPQQTPSPEAAAEPAGTAAAKPGKVKAAKAKAARKGGKKKKAGQGKTSKAKKSSFPDVYSIIPFTDIRDGYIEYGTEYYAKVVEIPSTEFRFLTENRQNAMIDKVFGSILRMISGSETGLMVKIDRPVIYDSYIKEEEGKLEALKEAFLNELMDEEELTRRVAIVYDRIDQISHLNYREKIYQPFYYFVFIHRDKNLLCEQTSSMVSVFGTNDMECRILGDQELAVFLKYNYCQEFDEREISLLKPEQYMDWILPDSIEFASRTIRYDNIYTHTFRLTDYPMLVGNAWGHQLFNMPGTRVVMKMKPVEQFKAIRRIDRAIDELRGQEGSTGKASRLIELGNHIDTLSELLTLLQGDNEVLFDVNLFVTVFDYELSRRMEEYKKGGSGKKKEPANLSLKRQIKRSMMENGFKSTDMLLQQFEAYASSSITARDCFETQSRGIHSGSVAAAFPFVYPTVMDQGGFNIGRSGYRPVFMNFFKRDKERVNSNMVVIGKSGSGKSYATKTLLSNLAAEDSKIFILDPENEYQALAENLKGKIIDVGSATQGRLNPFQIITGISDDEDDEDAVKTSFNTHLQFLEEFFRQILPGIENDALEYLNNLIIRMYEAKDIDGNTDLSRLTPGEYPIFDDLYDKILGAYQTSKGDYSKGNLRVLLNYISKFATGGRNAAIWNGEATISTNENFIVFNFQSLLANKNNTIANAQMLLVLKWLDNEIIKNRDYNLKYKANRKIIVVIDEAHVFIDPKFPIALDFMFQLAKRIRKYNGMQIIITQNIKDFVGTEEIARKSTAIINACQYSFIFPLAPNDMHDLCRLYEKAGAINESEQEEIVNNGRGRAFVITSPTKRTSVDIVATQEVQELFSM